MIKSVAISLIAIAMATPALAAGNADAGRTKATACFACHGADGNAVIPNYPKLAGQNAGYLVKQLQDFKDGLRKNPIMSAMVVTLKPQDMEDIAAYFSEQKRTLAVESNKALSKMGEDIYRGGIESKAVPACMACHSPDGAGNPPAKYPSLGGQNAGYVAKTLQDFRSGARGANPKDSAGNIMHSIAKRLDDAQIKAVAYYVSGLH